MKCPPRSIFQLKGKKRAFILIKNWKKKKEL